MTPADALAHAVCLDQADLAHLPVHAQRDLVGPFITQVLARGDQVQWSATRGRPTGTGGARSGGRPMGGPARAGNRAKFNSARRPRRGS